MWSFCLASLTYHDVFEVHSCHRMFGEVNATHSSVLAWRILGTGEPGGLPSLGSHGVGHDGRDLAAAAADCLGYLFHI